jgi:hypothetical protein
VKLDGKHFGKRDLLEPGRVDKVLLHISVWDRHEKVAACTMQRSSSSSIAGSRSDRSYQGQQASVPVHVRLVYTSDNWNQY